MPAFPAQFFDERATGMTLRDYFAAKVLTDNSTIGSPYEVAKWAYEVADAMLKARAL